MLWDYQWHVLLHSLRKDINIILLSGQLTYFKDLDASVILLALFIRKQWFKSCPAQQCIPFLFLIHLKPFSCLI
ncbi:hypothetical protein TNCV_1644321 [Trichonephila clavipes]|nr:hypothetical protein TNCV_1644321 [Trichonephila clavipes]